jgi:hypothetical protein
MKLEEHVLIPEGFDPKEQKEEFKIPENEENGFVNGVYTGRPEELTEEQVEVVKAFVKAREKQLDRPVRGLRGEVSTRDLG